MLWDRSSGSALKGRKSVVGVGQEAGNPTLPPGLSQGSYLRAAGILDLPLSLAPAPPAKQGWETTGLPRELEAFWNPQSVFSTPPKAAVLCSKIWIFLLVGGKRRVWAGEGGSWESQGHRFPGHLFSILCGRASYVCIQGRVGAT